MVWCRKMAKFMRVLWVLLVRNDYDRANDLYVKWKEEA